MFNSLDSKPSVFFYCCPPGLPNSKTTVYQHQLVCLAEGLQALGIPFYSDRPFWKTAPHSDGYLFTHHPDVTPDDCDIVVLHTAWFTADRPMPEKLFHPQRRYRTVYIESEADARHGWQSEFRAFDLILRTHYNSRFQYPKNFHPWAFGLSNRMLQELENLPDFSDRRQALLVNFRLGHPIRKAIQTQFLPLIQATLPIDESVDSTAVSPTDEYAYLHWVQTDRRHYPNYYQRLRETAACACFGGLLINPWPLDAFGPSKWEDRLLNKILTIASPTPRRIMNWESWRLWEAMAAGCIAFHVDFEKYGVGLPVMPVNWTHYIGVDLDDMQAAADRLAAEPQLLSQISAAGRAWAIQHYSPVPTALRFLETVQATPAPTPSQSLETVA
ncbi:MAG: glycosyltransferase [Oculatellaceae cyanobacterium Prado106]|jgi:hypothetical protein|nr:glycosyltransferase [Oculatellaceae cyanobacterium Prado106]